MTKPINANTTVMIRTVLSALGRMTDRSLLNDQGRAKVPASLLFRPIPFQHPENFHARGRHN
jgi:hypothetical protein